MALQFNWAQAKSMLSRWGWVEDSARAGCWTLGGYGKTSILVPAVEDLECRDEYDKFVLTLAGVYGLNPHALNAMLGVELCE